MILRSAGVRVLIALPGAIGYILVGLGRSDLPPGSLGFISIFAFAQPIIFKYKTASANHRTFSGLSESCCQTNENTHRIASIA